MSLIVDSDVAPSPAGLGAAEADGLGLPAAGVVGAVVVGPLPQPTSVIMTTTARCRPRRFVIRLPFRLVPERGYPVWNSKESTIGSIDAITSSNRDCGA